jgi:Tol biopolymer transport system component
MRDLSRSQEAPVRFTFDNAASADGNIVWSPEGAQVIFSVTSTSIDLYRKDVHSTAPAQPLVRNANRKAATDWSRDGKYLRYTQNDPKTGSDLWYLPLDAGGAAKPVPFFPTEFDESYGQLSPDGRWIAYVSSETGDYEVYVRAFPSGQGKLPVSASASRHAAARTQPRWSHDGKELFYLAGGVGQFTLMSSAIHSVGGPGGAATLEIGAPKPLFEVRANTFHPASGTFFYSVSRDGQRFLMNVVDSPSDPVLSVVVNWQLAVSRNK